MIICSEMDLCCDNTNFRMGNTRCTGKALIPESRNFKAKETSFFRRVLMNVVLLIRGGNCVHVTC
jgi:hypothetical protein